MSVPRLSADVTGPLAGAVTMLAVLVFAVGTARALAARERTAAELAAAFGFALELLLAAGLLRLANAQDLRALGLVAGIIVARQLIAAGLRFGARTAEAAPRSAVRDAG